jgi:hypothetical protein
MERVGAPADAAAEVEQLVSLHPGPGRGLVEDEVARP